MRRSSAVGLAFAATVTAAVVAVAACGGGKSGATCGAGTTLQGNECVVIGDSGSSTDAAATNDGGAGEGGEAGVCPSGRGPTMVALPAAGGGTFCIDSTEVTNAQYASFVQAVGGGNINQPAECSWNTSLQGPCDGPVPGGPDYPVACVDWCDAYAYCQWAGKALCDFAATSNGWQRACSSGEQYDYVYGDTWKAGRCIDSTYDASRPVGSASGCQSPAPQYAGVFDLLGNVAEWGSPCSPSLTSDAAAAAYCPVSGGGFSSTFPFGLEYSCEPDGGFVNPSVTVEDRDYVDTHIGFRCCANQ